MNYNLLAMTVDSYEKFNHDKKISLAGTEAGT
jgi:hypothetical protein